MKIRILVLLFTIYLIPTSCHAQPSILWSFMNNYNFDTGKFLLIDSQNKCYSISDRGGITKFELNGDTVFNYHDSGLVNQILNPRDAIMDHDDHIIVAYDYSLSNNNLIVVTKLDTNGTLVWQLIVNAPSGLEDRVNGIDIDAENNIYLTGYDGTQFSGKLFTAKISSGGILMWETGIGNSITNDENEGFDIAVRDSNNIYAVGDVYENYSYPCNTWLVKYNHVGDTLWTREFDFEDYSGGTMIADDNAKKISLDPAGNIYILLWSVASHHSVVIKYTSNGLLQWAHELDSFKISY